MSGAGCGRSLLAAASLLLACTGAKGAGAPGPATRAQDAVAPEAAARARCGKPIEGLTSGFTRAVEPGSILLLGELHGTQELPAFAGEVVCQLLGEGRSVTLALELPVREQAALERYLASGGTDEDLRALSAGPFWRRPEQDGRSSRAIVDLVERARQLRSQGLPLSLLAFDVEGLQASAHDRAMAEVLLAHRKQAPGRSLVVLTGNVHASTRQGVSWDKEFRPVGWHLEKAGEQVRAFDAMHQGGEAWGCRLAAGARLACGPSRARAIVTPNRANAHLTAFAVGQGGRPPPQLLQLQRAWDHAERRNGTERSFFLHMAPNEFPPGFDGFFYVPRVSASPPARMPEAPLGEGAVTPSGSTHPAAG